MYCNSGMTTLFLLYLFENIGIISFGSSFVIGSSLVPFPAAVITVFIIKQVIFFLVFLNFDTVFDKLNNCLKVGAMKFTKRGYENDF